MCPKIHNNHKFYARTFWNQNFMNIDFIVISAHKQKQKRVCVICIKWALCISDVYMHAFTIICYNVLEKHPCYNCGDPIIFPPTGMLINMQFVWKRGKKSCFWCFCRSISLLIPSFILTDFFVLYKKYFVD